MSFAKRKPCRTTSYGCAKGIASLARKCEKIQGFAVVACGKTVVYRCRQNGVCATPGALTRRPTTLQTTGKVTWVCHREPPQCSRRHAPDVWPVPCMGLLRMPEAFLATPGRFATLSQGHSHGIEQLLRQTPTQHRGRASCEWKNRWRQACPAIRPGPLIAPAERFPSRRCSSCFFYASGSG
jgi:hypothetical protein